MIRLKCIHCLATVFALSTSFGFANQFGPNRNIIFLSGRVVGYSVSSSIRSTQGSIISAPHDAFLFIVDNGADGIGNDEYVKIQLRSDPRNVKELPSNMFEADRRRSILVTRDESCDETVESFYYGYRFKTQLQDLKQMRENPDVIMLEGSEELKLPMDIRLRCFSFTGVDE
ncbi:MAG: hypothetical protein ABIP75_06000 [Pyrinomonadaceae bacterium]